MVPAPLQTPAEVQLSFGSRSDVGRKRSVNEDSLLAEFPVFIVADGMGGHDAGDRASAAVIDQFRSLVSRADVSADEVIAAVDKAHLAVQAVAEGTQRGAGSTLSGVVLVQHEGQPHWLVFNIGDSRVYRMVDTELSQLTVDHSLAQQLIDAGTLAPEDAASFPRRNVITRAVGAPDSAADYWLRPLVSGERIFVCSDGLSGELVDEAIRAGLTLGGSTQQTADAMLGRALERGGRDNITVVVIDVLAGGTQGRHDSITSSVQGFGVDDSTIDARFANTVELPGRRGRGHAA